MTAAAAPMKLPLFPLRTVLFRDGLLALKIFEARYLDLVSRCLRERAPFGVVCLREGGEVKAAQSVMQLEGAGTLAHIEDVDGDQPGILHIRCRGGGRFRLLAPPQAGMGGLHEADVELDDAPPRAAPDAQDAPAAEALARAIEAIGGRGGPMVLKPWRFDDAGWVADRWSELLPITLAARQKLLELDDGVLRLRLVADFLRQKKVIA